MDEVVEVIEDEKEEKLIHQFAKFAIGIVVAFAASQVVEKAYDRLVINRRKDDYIDELN